MCVVEMDLRVLMNDCQLMNFSLNRILSTMYVLFQIITEHLFSYMLNGEFILMLIN